MATKKPMKFTSYYSKLIKAHGVPQLSAKSHFLLMNILFLEASMHALDTLKCEGQSQTNKNKQFQRLKWKLRDLTGNAPPEVLMERLMG